MSSMSDIVKAVKQFVSEKGKVTVTIAAILIVLFISACITGIVQCATRPPKAVTIQVKEPTVTSDNLLTPENGSLTEDYYFSRIAKDKWSDQEVDRWFTEPTDNAVDMLKEDNDKLVNDITGAAP